MFKALMGGGRSSSDVQSTTSSKNSRRKSQSKSAHSRKSSRGDDRDRGLGDLTSYEPSTSGRSRGAPSIASDSVASFVSAKPESADNPGRIERTPKRRDSDRESKSSRRRDRDRSESRERDRERRSRGTDDRIDDDDDQKRDRRERRRTRSGDLYMPTMPSSAPGAQFATDVAAPGFSQFPGQYASGMPPAPFSPAHESTPSPYDPHVQQQFPGQFPTVIAEPYLPNPAGAAADYYGDQGQSVQDQPGVRPPEPLVIPPSQAHLQAASPNSNPPPEPSSMGQVGAAAAYFADTNPVESQSIPSKPSKPSNPSKPSKPSKPSVSGAVPAAAAAGAVGYGLGNTMSSYEEIQSQHSTTAYQQQQSSSYSRPPGASSTSKPPKPGYGVGTGIGAAAAGAAAGYMLGHQHHSSSPENSSQYTFQNYEQSSQTGLPLHGSGANNAMMAAGAAGAAGYAGHHAHSHSHPIPHRPGYYPYAPGGLAYQQRHRGPLSKFVDFWRDPEGVGRFEDYTETIGVCKYCFDPHSSSIDAPRKHHYHRRRHSADRYSASSSSRVSKLSRYHSSEDESRRKRSKKSSSWLPGMLAGYAAKSIFSGKDFNDSYNLRSGRMAGDRASSYDGDDMSDRRSYTSRGVVRRTDRSPQREYYSDSKHSRRARSRSSSRSGHHSFMKEAALGAAVGGAALAVSKSHQRSRSRSPSRAQRRKESSSSSSFVDVSRPAAKSVGGFTSFFTSTSENQKKKHEKKKGSSKKKRRGFFSFSSSSSSSLDNDLAFGTGFSKKSKSKKEKKSKKDEDVNAALMGLGATATALAASSSGRGRSTGQMLSSRDPRSRHSNYNSSANEDDEWIDADSSDESPSSVSSALAFGGSSADSSSDSGRSRKRWSWGWRSSKKDKKKDKKSAALAAGAGALGGAAIASVARHRDSRPPSEAGSLQQVYPMPTSDPSRFDAAKVSTSVASDGQPPLVRPGPIPLQQPQPVTPVSQSVYTTQGGFPSSIPAYSAPVVPPIFANEYDQYDPRFQPQASRDAVWSQDDVERRKPRRSDSSPVFPTQENQSVSSLKRRSTAKDQASVSFNLTEEQAERERRLNRLDQRSREEDDSVQLIDREEEEEARRDAERRGSERVKKESSSSSWVEAAAAGAIGAAAVSAISHASHEGDDASETSSRRYKSRRDKRRADRQQPGGIESSTISSVVEPVEVRDKPSKRSTRKATSPSPVYDDYAEFYAPAEIRHSPDEQTRDRDVPEQPSIVEVMPANVRKARGELREEEMSRFGQEPYENHDHLPWPVPRLNYIDPTPPHSVNGSALGISGPTSAARAPETDQLVEYVEPDKHVEHAEHVEPPEPVERKQRERPSTGSRVSWGEHSTHEYEVPSSSDQDPLEHDISPLDDKELPMRKPEQSNSRDIGSAPSYGEDIEFAAIVAAGTEAAGFDPSFVINDPKYHTRTSPPGSEDEGIFSPHYQPQQPHGFVEGEIDIDEPSQSREITPSVKHVEEKPIYAEPEPLTEQEDVTSFPTPERGSIAQEVIETLNGKGKQRPESLEDHEVFSMPGGFETAPEPRDDSRSVSSAPVGKDYERKKSRRSDDDFELSHEVRFRAEEVPATSSHDVSLSHDDSRSVFSAPPERGNKKEKESRKSRRGRDDFDFSHTTSSRDVSPSRSDSRSVFSAPAEREYEQSSKSRKSHRSGDDFDLHLNIPANVASPAPSDGEAGDGEKKRRKRRSKRDSDTFSVDDDARSAVTSYEDADKSERRKHRHRSSRERDLDDTASVTSSPAWIDETREKRKSREDKERDDDARSAVTSYDDDADKTERRKHRHRSSRERDFDDKASVTSSPARIDETREKRKSKDDKEPSSGSFLRNIFGSRVSAPADDRNRSTTSLEKRSSRETISEVGFDDERRRRKKRSSKSRSSSGGDSLYGSDNADETNLEEYRSRRQEKEERRRHRYEEIVESGKRRDYEKV
ncbi:hypothetical protein N7532_003479 [Penicillium argentinense]|uniref:Involucrin repeat protein n=1 Tax=Penicillium argentinense TaxID=1131581 RepID=A0A9W9FN35_9EURO|nr:uncharacterized protein N7532_003479 [Penicillium argentinense]KAJ5102950.1 hypothetical protein N7532_003479 [Penicillium argentinense]